MRELTQSLGPLRELDVELAILDRAADGDSVSSSALALVRREVASRRQALRDELGNDPPVADLKKLIKKLEKVGQLERAGTETGRTRKKARKRDAAWRDVLAARLLRRAKNLGAALEEAGPLYGSDRIHGVRVSTKKLRYALELARDAGEPRVAALVKALKQHQTRLGRLHDLQALLKHVRETEASPRVGSMLSDLAAYADSLDRECRRLHAEFVEHRDGLLDCVNQVRCEVVPAMATTARTQVRTTRPARSGAARRAKAG